MPFPHRHQQPLKSKLWEAIGIFQSFCQAYSGTDAPISQVSFQTFGHYFPPNLPSLRANGVIQGYQCYQLILEKVRALSFSLTFLLIRFIFRPCTLNLVVRLHFLILRTRIFVYALEFFISIRAFPHAQLTISIQRIPTGSLIHFKIFHSSCLPEQSDDAFC